MSSPTPELPISTTAAAPAYVAQKRPPTMSAEIQPAKTAKAEAETAETAETAKPFTFKEESSSDSEVGNCTNCHYNSQGKHCSFQPKSKLCERSIPVASSSAGSAGSTMPANKRKRVTKRKYSSTKEKWRKLLEAVEDMADAIQDIMEDMED